MGVDPNRVVAAGGSAGGHLAACTGVIEQFDESNEDQNVSSKPNAMALFNPALVLAPVDEATFSSLGIEPVKKLVEFEEERLKDLQKRAGAKLVDISPFHNLPAQTGPCIIFHGEADTTVPFASAELFTAAAKKAGNQCNLVGYPGKPHGFFNFGRDKNVPFRATLNALDQFLVDLGYLTKERSEAAEAILNQ